MGNDCGIVTSLKTFEHASENIRCNDDFFTLFSFFSLENHHNMSLLDKAELTYHSPSSTFLDHERSSPPKLLLEIRKGVNFPVFTTGAALCVRVNFYPSGLSYASLPAVFPNPRWYFLTMRGYATGEEDRDHTAVVEVLTKTGAMARAVIDLEEFSNQYCVTWMPIRMLKDTSQPSIEVRVWNLVEPKVFWETNGKQFRSAMEIVRNALLPS